jgi:citronellol/citronellal dehydrogenase
MAEEFRKDGIAVNSLWPETGIDTAAIRMLGGEKLAQSSRTTDIVADAAYWILTQPAKECTGNFFVDADVLRKAGHKDLSKYATAPGNELMPDFFLD